MLLRGRRFALSFSVRMRNARVTSVVTLNLFDRVAIFSFLASKVPKFVRSQNGRFLAFFWKIMEKSEMIV